MPNRTANQLRARQHAISVPSTAMPAAWFAMRAARQKAPRSAPAESSEAARTPSTRSIVASIKSARLAHPDVLDTSTVAFLATCLNSEEEAKALCRLARVLAKMVVPTTVRLRGKLRVQRHARAVSVA